MTLIAAIVALAATQPAAAAKHKPKPPPNPNLVHPQAAYAAMQRSLFLSR